MFSPADRLRPARRPDPLRPETLAVHGGRDDFAALGVHAPPIDLSSTNPVSDLAAGMASLDALVAGGEPTGSSVYARLHNPTVARVEEAIAALEGARGTVAYASGMAAFTAVLMALRIVRGDTAARPHVVAVRPMYGSADHLLAGGLLGVDVTFTPPDRIAAARRDDTALVCVETPMNPTVALLDLADVRRQAGAVPVCVDATFATPMLLRPLAHGATLVLHSATKALGGHGDVLAGVVSTNDGAWLAALRQVRALTGAVLHPLAAFLLHRGLQTLPLRVERAQRNAQQIAERLAAHPAVAAVHYPGLPGGDPHGVVGREQSGPGSVLAFELVADDPEVPARLMRALRLVTPAVSLGSCDSLIQHPASLTHRVVEAHDREASGVSARLMRLSVGIEHADDLWADLSQALDASHDAAFTAARHREPADTTA